MNTLAGKVVWITGASSGIGESLAYVLAEKQAVLVLSARRGDELERVGASCFNAAKLEVVEMDMEKTGEIEQKVRSVIKKMGCIDIVIHCAGISQRSLAKDTNIDVYRKIMEANYFGTVQLSLAVLPYFLQRNQGQFVAISSVTGKIGLPLRTAYCASKHAVEGFFGALRTELWKSNIKILLVRPGAVKTNIAINALTGTGAASNKKDKMIENGISAAKCAEAIVQAIIKHKKELIVGSAKEKLVYVINRFSPEAVFNFVKRLGNNN